MELGIYTFADMALESVAGKAHNIHRRIAELMEEITLADQVGLDVFAVGEHHRPEYAVSSPGAIPGAAAVATKKIKLSSAVTVLSSDDPVRVFMSFAAVDQLSGGRAEIMVGYNLKDCDALFAEKLDLLLRINKSKKLPGRVSSDLRSMVWGRSQLQRLRAATFALRKVLSKTMVKH